mmetsp:Transcript_8495/g.16931  ORF Transcript_8495/g.16931 Transcript_8495/m.16931 type:complete len:279 (+) Transcript_8495:536-1372(+)
MGRKRKAAHLAPNLFNHHEEKTATKIKEFYAEMREEGRGTIQIDKFNNICKEGHMNSMIVAPGIMSKIKLLVCHTSVTGVITVNGEWVLAELIAVVMLIGIDAVCLVVTDGAAAETWARKQLVLHFKGLLWEMRCAAHAWDLFMERVAKKTFMESVVKAVNEIIAFIYQHGFVKALWDCISCVICMPRAAGTRFATFHITVVAFRCNEPAIRTLFADPELKQWVLTDKTGKLHADTFEDLAERYVTQNACWRRLEVFYLLFGPFVTALLVADNGAANL